MNLIDTPLGLPFAILTKQYFSILNTRLKDLPIDRYFYSLFVIAKANGTIGQKELAEKLFADKVTVVRIIDYFEKMEMVVRIVSEEDRRCHFLQITKKATPFIDEIEKAINETNELFLSFISPDCKELFSNELAQLSRQIQQIPGDRYDFLLDKIAQSDENE